MPNTSGSEESLCWSSPAGHRTIKEILTRRLPQWPGGPYDWQIKTTAEILDGHDIFLVAGCGEGKTAAAYLHLLVLHELLRNPNWVRFGRKIPSKPVVLMVSPLNDLSLCHVSCARKCFMISWA